jgi:hypothetical protein
VKVKDLVVPDAISKNVQAALMRLSQARVLQSGIAPHRTIALRLRLSRVDKLHEPMSKRD